MTEPGSPFLLEGIAEGADLRTDIPKVRRPLSIHVSPLIHDFHLFIGEFNHPSVLGDADTVLSPLPTRLVHVPFGQYWVWRQGRRIEECNDVSRLWGADMVGFLLGCSFSWETHLATEGLVPRQVEEGKNVPMFRTNIRNHAVGPFRGDFVVSMRPYLPCDIPRLCAITGQYPAAHGAPVHWGDPGALGISPEKLMDPDWGEAVTVREGEIPVFWPCGVTSQSAVLEAAPNLAITHAPGHMFITDVFDHELQASVAQPPSEAPPNSASATAATDASAFR